MRGGFTSGITPYGVLCVDLVIGTPKAKSWHQKTGMKTLLTDEQVLECRRLHEYEGWKPQALVQRYAEFGVTKGYMDRLLQYLTRSKLIPKPPK